MTKSQILFFILIVNVFILLLFFIVLSFVSQYKRKKKQHELTLLFRDQEHILEKISIQNQTKQEVINMMSQELHDNIGQILSSSKMLIASSIKVIQNVPEALLLAEKNLKDAIIITKDLSYMFNQNYIAEFNLEKNVFIEIEKIKCISDFEIVSNLKINHLLLSNEKQFIVFRMLQEVFNNILTHAKANMICINAKQTELDLEFEIIDNGRGFIYEDVKDKSSGIRNLQQRAKILNGRILWQDNVLLNGTCVIIKIPLSL